jgi:hypothetical protein
MPGENGCGLAREGIVRLVSEQGKRVSGGAVRRDEAAVVVVLPPERVVAPPGTHGCGRLARRLLPARLAGPFAHREGGE